MNGAACYNQAHRSWSACGTCGYMPEYGLMQKVQLCCACIHEGFQERQQKDNKAPQPCRCHVSLWWWDHEYDRRLEWLRLNNPGFVEKVKMRPARVSTDAAHQAPQVNAAASTDQQPWRADVRVDAPVPNGPQSACRTAASSDAWGNFVPNTQRNYGPCGPATMGTPQHTHGSPVSSSGFEWLNGINGKGGPPASSWHPAPHYIGRHQASELLCQNTWEMFGQLQAMIFRIEARLGRLEGYLEEINDVQQGWRWTDYRSRGHPNRWQWYEGAKQLYEGASSSERPNNWQWYEGAGE